MLRMPHLVAALLSAIALAAVAPAADTGMLYVKSDPPGATVVIGGVERGKTPVLVKGLPVGETEITFRIEGAKPVVVRETIEANKVARVSAEIDVPGASLTVISDPLEATVYLDQMEHGKTPISIDGLPPGKHELLLLKAGFPRTARSIVLVAGEERVLEVKLGTAEEDEEPAPAQEVDADSRAEDDVPVEVQLILTMLQQAAAKGDLAKTRKSLGIALTQANLAGFKAELRAGIEVMRALESRRDAIRRGAEELIGKEATLRTKAGSREGTVQGVTEKGIKLSTEIRMRGRVVGKTTFTVALNDLTGDQGNEIAKGWDRGGPDASIALALLALARGDLASAGKAAAAAGDHVLAGPVSAKARAAKRPPAKVAAGKGGKEEQEKKGPKARQWHLTGEFVALCDQIADVYLNRKHILRAQGFSIPERSDAVTVTEGDLLVVKLQNSPGSPRGFRIAFKSDTGWFLSFEPEMFADLDRTDPESVDVAALQAAGSKAQRAKKLRVYKDFGFPNKVSPYWLWGRQDICTVATVITRQNLVKWVH
ncbi:MAG: PEGA domain-containing protein [Planctomycetota bacterium]|jgi:hypothetical protein